MSGKFEFGWLTRDRKSAGIDPPALEESTVEVGQVPTLLLLHPQRVIVSGKRGLLQVE